ncbi:GNAT family N-acetyltransferase [Devosia sp. FJ2-5-3]|uniref:GNAT family N-acetyltransferase n=1 Tax=Devosia sp. FJ2-5-3 TaxID=2976680 RepID=UPI0023D81285|nr:GNAT family N-acetyltransferase [Devosia sp. FJ2-5-3]WEJ56889.1 GNAT family N-acetyltransferase [Devosia sp. FJ2-5-3]
MNTWSSDLTTRTGYTFAVRKVQPADGEALAEFFRHVTPEDLRFRFLSTVKHVSQERLDEMINVDHHTKESFIALERDTSTIIAVAMLGWDPVTSIGEVAVSIRKDHKGRGISWELLGLVIRFAEANGIRTLQCVEDRANASAIRLEREMGFKSRPYSGDSTLTVLEKAIA